MQSNLEMHEGKSVLQNIINEFPVDHLFWSEAQNRFQFIDRLLIECLGWPKTLITVEKFDDKGGRADYLLGKPVRAALEAKKEAKRFSFPPTARPRSNRKLKSLISSCGTLKEACTQVISYCALHGARLAIVCNGPQLVLFQSLADGRSPLEGECYVFDGFDSYIEHFDLLWRFLSPEGVFENTASRNLAELQNPRLPMKASTSLGEPKGYRYRTDFQDNLRTLASVLLDNVEDNPAVKSDFYRECYVSMDANNRHLLLSKNVITSRYKRATDNGVIPARINTKVRNGKVDLDQNMVSFASGRPVVVLGDVGVGKTSFFENLFEQLDAFQKKKTLYIHINLGEEAALATDIKTYVLQRIPVILRDQYGIDIDSNDFVQKIYYDRLSQFDSSVHGQLKGVDDIDYRKERIKFLADLVRERSQHLLLCFGYIARNLDLQLLIVLDNADQRTYETQQEAFLVSQELASGRNSLVFVALRPATFYASKLNGALSGYKNEVLTISPPPADEVIQKRISFALRVAEGRIAPAALKGVSLNLSNIVSFLTAMLRSIRSNADIRTFLSNITGGNTRLVIELVTSFCGSPNVESERIVRIERETGDYKVPLHEFTKHALLGEYSYYNPTSSFVACNVFDVTSADRREHFLSILLISYLTSPTGARNNDGFINGSAIRDEMMRLSYGEQQIRSTLRRLASARLIETPHGHYREIPVETTVDPETFYFRATSVGIYHARYWVGSFSFLDATCIDTPIFDEEINKKITRLANSFNIEDRYVRSSEFCKYLETVWFDANFDITYYDFPAILAAQRSSFTSVERHINRKERNNHSLENK